MIFLGLALAAAFIGALPALLSGKGSTFGILGFVYFVFALLCFYFDPPSLDYTLGGWVSGASLLFLFATAVVLHIMNDGMMKIPTFTFGGGFLVLVIVLMSGCAACRSDDYSSLAGDLKGGKNIAHWTQHHQELSPTHIRIVPEEHAISIGKTSLNQHSDDSGNIIGSQFPLDGSHTTLQKVKDELFYVMPLDYANWAVWNNTSNGVPGFVLMNAEDQHAAPEYVNGHSMKYTPGACFSTNLERHLYTNGYADKVLRDYCFEVDDDLKPYWVVSVCHHTIGMYSGLVVDGVVVVEPESGEITYYDKGKAPEWIDRIIPEEVVHDNLNYWGQYSSGFWNNTGFGAQNNLREAEATVLNYGSDGMCWYVTPMTSTSSNDHSMTDLVYTNSRTGEQRRYSASGATEEKVIATVDATVNFQNLHAAAVVYENVGNRMTGLVPILAADHSIRGLALVDVETKGMKWHEEPRTALMEYQKMVMSLGSIGTDIATLEKHYSGVVDRITQSVTTTGSTYYLYFKGRSHIYVVPQTFNEVLVTQPGDSLRISFLDTEADLVSVNHFENLDLDIQKSDNQRDVEERAEKRMEAEQKSDLRTSAKNSIRNGEVSDEMLDSLATKLSRQ